MTSSGKELKNKALEEALKNNKFAFTLDEFEEFNVSNVDLAESCYIIVQGKYYKPAALKQDDNFMLQFLKYGKLAYVFGSNLFVHGAIDERNKEIVPGRKEPVQIVHEWADALNIWSRREVEAFEENPYHHANSAHDDKGTQSAGLYRTRSAHDGTLTDGTLTAGLYRERNGNALMDYGVPNGNGGETVVYNHFLHNGNSKQMSREVQEYLLSGRIQNVISGHCPHGDCPTPLRTGPITVITADTSFSQMGHTSSWGTDHRGTHAVSEVIVYIDGTSEVHGILASGTTPLGTRWEQVGCEKPIGTAEVSNEIQNTALATALKDRVKFLEAELVSFGVGDQVISYDSYIQVDTRYYRPSATKIAYKLGVGGDKFVGRQLSNGAWVKARTLGAEPEYLLALGEGFNLSITRKKVWELEALTDAHFMEQSYHDNDLNAAGIDSVFHATLIAAGLDLETLKMAADDRRYLDCTLEKAGISKPGDRVKIVKAIYPKA